MVLAGLSIGTGQSVAADDGYDNVFSSVLTAVGVMKSDASPEIEYRERAPLVLPPKMELAKPVPPGAARTAAWPQDPDVLKRRKAGEEARAPSENLLGNRRETLSKEELLKGRTAETPESAVRASNCGVNGNNRSCLLLSPDQLQAEHEHYEAAGGNSSSNKDLVAGVEPDRLYLTQPPKGYMKTTKTVKATAEAPVQRLDPGVPASALVYKQKTDDDQ
jgi:hypothetical protein